MNITVAVIHKSCGAVLSRYEIVEHGADKIKEELRTMPWGCPRCLPGPIPGTSLTVPVESISVQEV